MKPEEQKLQEELDITSGAQVVEKIDYPIARKLTSTNFHMLLTDTGAIELDLCSRGTTSFAYDRFIDSPDRDKNSIPIEKFMTYLVAELSSVGIAIEWKMGSKV